MSYPLKMLRLPVPRHPLPVKQRGVVIIIALLIVALVAAMATTMMSRLARDTRRVELIMHDAQAALYADGSVLWAKDVLHNNWIRQKKDKRVDALPLQSPENEMQGYKINGNIQDAQARFNINNISKPEWQTDLIKLIRLVDPNISQNNAAEIVRATVDWIMPGARENEYARYYADLPVPYRAAHRFMVDISEWRLVKGVTPALFNAMKPYLIALPAVTMINPQTAAPPVLALMSTNMPLATAQTIRDMLAKNPPAQLEAFKALDIIKNHPLQDNKVTWVSNYFLVETEVATGEQRIILYTLLQRDNGNKANVWVLWQNRGSG